MADARLTALRGLNEVFGQGGYSNLVLESLMRKNELTGQERAFCTALFYGVVERRITLDWVLGRYSRQPVEKLSPAVRDILRMAVYQLLYMPSIPERAAVNEAVKETRAMRVSSASGYVNGVLRAFLRDGKKIALPCEPLAALSVQYAVPKALITLWRQGYGEETTRAILEGCQSPAPLFIRVNSQKTTAEALMEKLAEENITAEKTPVENALRLESAGDVTRLAAFREGLFHVQDLSSQKCAAALAVQPGHRVLDVCSAPGGKTFTLAEWMEDTGSLLAMDLYPHRLKLWRTARPVWGFAASKQRRTTPKFTINPWEYLTASCVMWYAPVMGSSGASRRSAIRTPRRGWPCRRRSWPFLQPPPGT